MYLLSLKGSIVSFTQKLTTLGIANFYLKSFFSSIPLDCGMLITLNGIGAGWGGCIPCLGSSETQKITLNRKKLREIVH